MNRKKTIPRTRLELPDRKNLPAPSENDAVKASTYGGLKGRTLGTFAKKVRERFDVPFAFLTDEQWESIARTADLRRHVRFEVNIALQDYWESRFEEEDTPAMSEELGEARANLKAAIGKLSRLLKNRLAFQGMLQPHEQSFAEQKLDLVTTVEWMNRTHGLLGDAEKRLKRKRGRQASYGNLHSLVQRLDAILYQNHGRVVGRSKKLIVNGTGTPLEFVWEVIQVADRNVSKSRVDKVVEDFVSDRRRFAAEFSAFVERLENKTDGDD